MTGGTVTNPINTHGMDGSTTNGWVYVFISGGNWGSGIQNAFDRCIKYSDGNWGVGGSGRVPAGCTMKVDGGKTATIGSVTDTANNLSVYGDLIVNGTIYNYGMPLSAADVTSGDGLILNLSHLTAKVINYKTIQFTPQDGYFNPSRSDISVTTLDGEVINTWTLSGATLTLPDYVSARGAIVTASAGTPVVSLTMNGTTTNHTTLQAAYDAIPKSGTGTITVLKNISCTGNGIQAEFGDWKNITLDLNGFKVEATGTVADLRPGSQITIKTSKEGGQIISGDYGVNAYGSTAILEGGSITGDSYGINCINVVIKGGSVTATRTNGGAGIAATGNVDIQGGTISGYTGIDATVDAQVTVSSGTITGAVTGIKVKDGSSGNGTLAISGGTINAPTDIDLSEGAGYTVSVSGGTYTDGLTVSGEGRTLQSILAEGTYCYQGDTLLELDSAAVTTGTSTVTVKNGNLADAVVELELPEGGYVYGGDEKKPAIKSVTLGGIALTADQYEVSYQNNVNAGQATVTLTAKDPYAGTKTVTFDIAPYAVKSADLEFVDTPITKEYDATTEAEASVQIKANTFGNAEAIAVAGSAVYNSKDVATANIVTFTPNAITTDNYTLSADQTLSSAATITPKEITVSGIQVADKIYDGTTAAQISNAGVLSGVETGDTVTVDVSNITAVFADKNVGEDKAITLSGVALGGADAGNYTLSDRSAATADITAKELTISDVVTSDQHLDLFMLVSMIQPEVNPYVDVTTGTLATPVAGDDVAVTSTTWYQKFMAADAIPVICKFSLTGADKENYVISSINGTAVTETDGVYEYASTAKVTCTYQPVKGEEYIISTNDWTNTSVTVTPASDAYILLPGDFPFDQIDASDPQEIMELMNGIDPTQIMVTEETDADGDTVAFYVLDGSNAASGKIPVSVQVAETYKIDTTLPAGIIKIEERQWDNWLGRVVFEYFTNKDVTVTINASDALSVVKKVEYLESAEAMSLEELKQSTNWKNGTSVNVTAEDAKQFVYYARITDNAGNVTIIGSDGTVFDTVLPVISGVENGKTYYTTQTVEITEINLDFVEVNGQSVEAPITLAGNVDAEYTYTILVKDKAGNESQVTVTMKPIASLVPETVQTTVDAVLLSQEQTLTQELAALNALDVSEATDAEKEVLEELKQKAEELLERIEEVSDALNTDALKEAAEITKNNVQLADEQTLVQAKEDLEEALDRYAGNLVGMEQELQEKQNQIEEALDAIGNAKDVQDLIDELPETAQPDDEEAIAAAKDASDAYDALTEQEKTMVDTEKLEDLLAALLQYKIIKNDGTTWTGTGTLEFTSNGPFYKFTGVKVDGVALKEEDYTAAAGSTIVTLKKEFLDTLTNGKHSVTICFNDGEAVGSFTVELPGNASTGDTSNPTLLIVLVAVSLVGIVVVILLLLPKKKGGKYQKKDK